MRVEHVLAIAIVLLWLAPAANAADDPLAPARAGKIWCSIPNSEHKTCRAMVRYSFENGRMIDNTEVALSDSPLDVATLSTEATLSGSRICETVSTQDVRSATVTRDGHPLAGTDAKAALQVVADFAAQREGQTVCVDPAPYNERTFTVQTFYDGAQSTRETYDMIWVGPDEGYRVGF